MHIEIHLRIRVRRDPDGSGLLAHCLELDQMTSGDDIEQLKANVRDMIQSYFVACEKMGTLGTVITQLLGGGNAEPLVSDEPSEARERAAHTRANQIVYRPWYSDERVQVSL